MTDPATARAATTPLAVIARYGVIGFLRLLRDLVLTRIAFPGARLVRRPVYVRGRRSIRVGRGFTTGVGLRLDAFPEPGEAGPCIEIGENVEVNDYVHIGARRSVRIGNNVLIASKVLIIDHNHGVYAGTGPHDSPETPPAARREAAAPIVIEDNVWIGEQVAILPGVRVGRGAVIGAMSLVSHDVPPCAIAAGIPARVIKTYDPGSKRWTQPQNPSS